MSTTECLQDFAIPSSTEGEIAPTNSTDTLPDSNTDSTDFHINEHTDSHTDSLTKSTNTTNSIGISTDSTEDSKIAELVLFHSTSHYDFYIKKGEEEPPKKGNYSIF